jgi:hypothetical protein
MAKSDIETASSVEDVKEDKEEKGIVMAHKRAKYVNLVSPGLVRCS